MILSRNTINGFYKETGIMPMVGMYGSCENYMANKVSDKDIEKFDCVTITGFDKEGYYIGKWFKTPKKKEVTLSYIMNKINYETVYRNLTNVFAKLCKKTSFYPTTYGFGIEVIWGMKDYEDEIEMINKKLENMGIEYRNEFSEAGWVYRYVISKNKSNLDKINKIN